MNLQAFLEMGPDANKRPLAQALLAACPWAWPTEVPALHHARTCSGAEEPADAPFGHAPILVKHEDQTPEKRNEAAVFLCATGWPPRGLTAHALDGDILPDVRQIRAELSRHLPLRPARNQPHFYAIDADRSAASTLRPLSGRSVGLSLALALAGDALRCPVPGDLACSATVEVGGGLGRVEGWKQKTEALALLPQVGRLLVALGDGEIAHEAFRSVPGREHVDVVECATLPEALSLVFGEDFLRRAIRERVEAERPDLAGRFFGDALKGTSMFVDWGPAADAIATALEWSDLTPELRGQLRFAHAVAARYARRPIEPDLPDDGWMQRQEGTLVFQVLAHLLQHHTRWGGSPRRWALELVDRAREMGKFADCLRVRGAWARWADARGEHGKARDEHAAVVDAWLQLHDELAASYSLTEWLRLAGALDDEPSFKAAADLAAKLEAGDVFGPLQLMYLRMSRAQGAWALSLRSETTPRWKEMALADIIAVRASPADLPNRRRVERVALRYLLYLDPSNQGARAELRDDPDADTDRALIELLDGVPDLHAWAAGLPPHHRWRADVLIGQDLDPEHILRFFVDA